MGVHTFRHVFLFLQSLFCVFFIHVGAKDEGFLFYNETCLLCFLLVSKVKFSNQAPSSQLQPLRRKFLIAISEMSHFNALPSFSAT